MVKILKAIIILYFLGFCTVVLLFTSNIAAKTRLELPPQEAFEDLSWGAWTVIGTEVARDGETAVIRLRHPQNERVVARLVLSVAGCESYRTVMLSDYAEFLDSKRYRPLAVGKGIAESDIHPMLFPSQRKVTQWACRKGWAAIFLDRRGIGIELKPSYCKIAVENLKEAESRYRSGSLFISERP